MNKFVFSLILASSLYSFGQTAPANPPKSDPKVVIPKESIESVKLHSNRLEAKETIDSFQNQVKSVYEQQIKPAEDKLDKEYQDLLAAVKKQNGWDDTYSYDPNTNQWSQNVAVAKGPGTPEPLPPPAGKK
jgi:hypothetical protein